MPKKSKKRSASVRLVPYAKGFIKPNPQQQTEAISKQGTLPKELTPGGDTFFQNIPNPTSIDDWLAQYNEEGQTYQQFLEECPWLKRRTTKSMKVELANGTNMKDKYTNSFIYLLPLGEFDNQHGTQTLFDNLQIYAEHFLGLPVKVLPRIKLEVESKKVYWVEEASVDGDNVGRRSNRKKQLDCRFHGNEKYQLKIYCILRKLKSVLPPDALCLIALTMADLYEASTDLFVAGMASGNERVAVFSLLRYNPSLTFSKEHWYDITEVTNQPPCHQQRAVMLQRSCKLLVHEVCHLLGIDHCVFFECCMNGSGHLEEDFRQPMFLCPVDLRKLQTLVGFSINDRYQKMLEFFKTHKMKAEVDWLHRRLLFIRS